MNTTRSIILFAAILPLAGQLAFADNWRDATHRYYDQELKALRQEFEQRRNNLNQRRELSVRNIEADKRHALRRTPGRYHGHVTKHYDRQREALQHDFDYRLRLLQREFDRKQEENRLKLRLALNKGERRLERRRWEEERRRQLTQTASPPDIFAENPPPLPPSDSELSLDEPAYQAPPPAADFHADVYPRERRRSGGDEFPWQAMLLNLLDCLGRRR